MDIVHLLLEDRLPDAKEKKALEEDVRRGGHLPEEILRICRLLPERTHPMDGLRTGLSALGGFDKDIDNRTSSVNRHRVRGLIGKMPNLTVNSYRVINGLEPLAPVGTLSYSANFYI